MSLITHSSPIVPRAETMPQRRSTIVKLIGSARLVEEKARESVVIASLQCAQEQTASASASRASLRCDGQDLFAVDGDLAGRFDAEAHLVAIDLDHRDR